MPRPERVYKTKKERCAAAKYKNTAACRITKSSGGRRVGVKRPAGNPLIPCIATEADLSAMTIVQIQRWASKNKITLPKFAADGVSRLRKDDLIAAALNASASASCPTYSSVVENLRTASMSDMGAYIRTHDMEPPRTCQRKLTKAGRPIARACREDYVDLVNKIHAERRPQPLVTPGTIPQVYSPSPVVSKLEVAPGTLGSGIVPGPSGTTEIATVTVSDRISEIMGNTSQIEFEVHSAGGTAYVDSLYNMGYKIGSTFVVDKECAVDAGAAISMSGNMSGLVQHCQMIDGKRDCSQGVIQIEQLPNDAAIQEWKFRVICYMAWNLAFPDLSLPFKAAWTCDSKDVEYYLYRSMTSRKIYGKGSGLCGFIVVGIPDGYTLFPLRDFMRNVSDPSRPGYFRTAYNWATTRGWEMVQSRYVESMVPDLIEFMYDAGVIPSGLSPETFGVLVQKGVALGYGDVYPYTPVLMPAMNRLFTFPDPATSLPAKERMMFEKKAIFDLVKNGYIAEGVKTPYKAAPGKLKILFYGAAAAVVATGGAMVATSFAPAWLVSIPGINVASEAGFKVVSMVKGVYSTPKVTEFFDSMYKLIPESSFSAYGTAMADLVMNHPYIAASMAVLSASFLNNKILGSTKLAALLGPLSAIARLIVIGSLQTSLFSLVAGWEPAVRGAAMIFIIGAPIPIGYTIESWSAQLQAIAADKALTPVRLELQSKLDVVSKNYQVAEQVAQTAIAAAKSAAAESDVIKCAIRDLSKSPPADYYNIDKQLIHIVQPTIDKSTAAAAKSAAAAIAAAKSLNTAANEATAATDALQKIAAPLTLQPEVNDAVVKYGADPNAYGTFGSWLQTLLSGMTGAVAAHPGWTIAAFFGATAYMGANYMIHRKSRQTVDFARARFKNKAKIYADRVKMGLPIDPSESK